MDTAGNTPPQDDVAPMSYETLLAMPIFADLSADAVKDVHERGEVVALTPNETIIREGDRNAFIFIVIHGELLVTLPDMPGRFTEVQLATRTRGECVGEYSFLDPHPGSATVCAKSDALVFRIPHDAFTAYLQSNPDTERLIYRNLLVSLVSRLRDADSWLDFLKPV